MRFSIAFFIVILLQTPLWSQTIGSVQLGGIPTSAGVASLNFNGINNSPLRLIEISNYAVSFNAVPSVHQIKDLNAGYAFAAMRIGEQFIAGTSLYGINSELYSEFDAGINLLWDADKFFASAKATYSSVNIQNYSSHSAVILDLGGGVHIDEMFSAAFALRNLTGANYGNIDKVIPRSAYLGLGVRPSQDLAMDIDYYVLFNRGSGFSVAMKYELFSFLSTRFAYQSEPAGYEIAIGTKLFSGLSLNFGMYYHSYLNVSTNIGIDYRL
jgi:hypothetical protein